MFAYYSPITVLSVPKENPLVLVHSGSRDFIDSSVKDENRRLGSERETIKSK
jgi:hypothetical protein